MLQIRHDTQFGQEVFIKGDFRVQSWNDHHGSGRRDDFIRGRQDQVVVQEYDFTVTIDFFPGLFERLQPVD